MHVFISSKTKYQSMAWSWGYCDSCQQHGALRLENVIKAWYLNDFIPVYENVVGGIARCDFCRRTIETVDAVQGIPLADWSPRDGSSALCKKCGVAPPPVAGDASSEVRLHSLLSSVQQSGSLTRIQLSPFGIGGGVIVALLVTIPLAMWLFEKKVIETQLDELGFTMMLSMASMLPGAILGALIECWLRREPGLRVRLREAYNNYPFDLFRLEELSRQYSKPVQKAVQTLCEEAQRNR